MRTILTHDLIILERKKFLLQSIPLLVRILSSQKSFDLLMTSDENISITPDTLLGVRCNEINTPPCLLCDQTPRREARTFDDNRWILRVPYVLGEFHFLEGG